MIHQKKYSDNFNEKHKVLNKNEKNFKSLIEENTILENNSIKTHQNKNGFNVYHHVSFSLKFINLIIQNK